MNKIPGEEIPETPDKEGRRTAPKNRRKSQRQQSHIVAAGSYSGKGVLGVKAGEFEIHSNTPVPIEKIRSMIKCDGQVSSCYNMILGPLRNMNFNIHPPEGFDFDQEATDQPGKEETAFIKRQFTAPAASGGMSIAFSDIYNQMVTALRDGFACFEKVWRVVYQDGKPYWMIRKLVKMPTENVKFVANAEGELEAVVQKTTTSYYYANQGITPNDIRIMRSTPWVPVLVAILGGPLRKTSISSRRPWRTSAQTR